MDEEFSFRKLKGGSSAEEILRLTEISSAQKKSDSDLRKKNDLISQQNKLVSTISDADEGFSFKKLKGRSSTEELQRLTEMSMDALDDSREVQREYKFVKDRVNKALLMSNDKVAHDISRSISYCRNARSIRSKKIRSKTKSYFDMDTRERYKVRVNTQVQQKLLDDKSDYANTDGVCQSLWCNSCRKVAALTFEDRVKSHIDRGTYKNGFIKNIEDQYSWYGKRSYEYLERGEYKNDDLLHITGVVGICATNSDDLGKLIKRDTGRWNKVRYQLRKTPYDQDNWIEVAYEIELVNWTFLRNSKEVGSEYKKQQIEQLQKHYKVSGNVILFVHWHGLTNLSKKQIQFVFGKHYYVGKDRFIKTDSECGIYIQSLHKDKTLEENVKRVCNYNFKNPVRYKHTFRGKEYKNGEYFSDEELGLLVVLYQRLQKRNWRGLYRTCVNDWNRELHSNRELYGKLNNRNWFRIYQQRVWVVDFYGNVFLNSWNPDSFLSNSGLNLDIKTNVKIMQKTKKGREYFMHPHFYWLEVYKVIWDVSDTGKRVRFNKVEDYVKFLIKRERLRGRYGRDVYKELKISVNKNSDLWEGWDYSVFDEKLDETFRRMRLYDELDEYEKFVVKVKMKRQERRDKRRVGLISEFDLRGFYRLSLYKGLFHIEESIRLEYVSNVDYNMYLYLLGRLLISGIDDDWRYVMGINFNCLISQNENLVAM